LVIVESDIQFITNVLLPYFKIDRVIVGYSASQARWPDIWCERTRPPRITVTEEWRRQNMHERRKRFVHELLHVRGLEHGRIGRLNYHTIPEKDSYSKYVYQVITGGHS